MSVLDIDERIEHADKRADAYLRWKAEDDEFQKKHPTSLIYLWFAEHSVTWKPEPILVDNPLENYEQTPLEKEYGKLHMVFGPGHPNAMVGFLCPTGCVVNIIKPGFPTDKSKALSAGTMGAFTRFVQLRQANMIMLSPDGVKSKIEIRFPSVIALKNVAEWPNWLIDSENCKCRQPWNGVTFWVGDSCDTISISNLVYQPGISCGEPEKYNFFRPSDYFLKF